MRYLYSLVFVALLPLYLYGLYKSKKDKPSVGKRWIEHFGFTPPVNDSIEPLWIHAVSVGEVLAITPLIKRLHTQQPSLKIVLTTTTPTGAKQAETLAGYVSHRYMPLDLSFAIRGFLKNVCPSTLVIVETELWPNLLHHVEKRGIPILVVNARLSERSFARYKKIPGLFQMIGPKLSEVMCHHSQDAQRFIKLGLPPSKVSITGSIKYDVDISPDTSEHGRQLRKATFGQRNIWTLASSHRGEDEQILRVHKVLLQRFPDLLLILVPRHPERFHEVFNVATKNGFNVVRRSAGTQVSSDVSVYLADTMGEMFTILSMSDICFMGGSLLGNKVGGHNLVEPAAMGVPTIIGPSYFNFKEITQGLIEEGATEVAGSDEEIIRAVEALVSSKGLREARAKNAMRVVAQNGGSIAKTIEKLTGHTATL